MCVCVCTVCDKPAARAGAQVGWSLGEREMAVREPLFPDLYRSTGERPAEGRRVARAPGNGPSARKWRAAATSRYALCSAARARPLIHSLRRLGPSEFYSRRLLVGFSPASRASEVIRGTGAQRRTRTMSASSSDAAPLLVPLR